MNSSFVGVACSDSTFQINTDKGTHLKGVVIVLSVTKFVGLVQPSCVRYESFNASDLNENILYKALTDTIEICPLRLQTNKHLH